MRQLQSVGPLRPACFEGSDTPPLFDGPARHVFSAEASFRLEPIEALRADAELATRPA